MGAYVYLAVYGIIALAVLAFGFYWVSKMLDPNAIRVRILSENRKRRAHLTKIVKAERGEVVRVGGRDYQIDRDLIFHEGIFRIPTADYIYGQEEPINPYGNRRARSRSDAEIKEIREAAIWGLLGEAFKARVLSPEVSLLLILVVIGGGLGYVWWDLSSGINAIRDALGVTQ